MQAKSQQVDALKEELKSSPGVVWVFQGHHHHHQLMIIIFIVSDSIATTPGSLA